MHPGANDPSWKRLGDALAEEIEAIMVAQDATELAKSSPGA